MLNLKDLRCFAAVYKLRGFARAAAELHTVQSAVSVRIRRLEDAFGAPLFERMHRCIAPTPQGDLLYLHAVRVLENVQELENAVRKDRAA